MAPSAPYTNYHNISTTLQHGITNSNREYILLNLYTSKFVPIISLGKYFVSLNFNVHLKTLQQNLNAKENKIVIINNQYCF